MCILMLWCESVVDKVVEQLCINYGTLFADYGFSWKNLQMLFR
jgi:hypothetical protein